MAEETSHEVEISEKEIAAAIVCAITLYRLLRRLDLDDFADSVVDAQRELEEILIETEE